MDAVPAQGPGVVSADVPCSDPVGSDCVYTEPTDALDDSDDVLPDTAASHFVEIADNCPGTEGIPPTTDTAPGYPTATTFLYVR